MAPRPAVNLPWASVANTQNVLDSDSNPISADNKTAYPVAWQDEGLQFQVNLPYNYLNYKLDELTQWIDYLDRPEVITDPGGNIDIPNTWWGQTITDLVGIKDIPDLIGDAAEVPDGSSITFYTGAASAQIVATAGGVNVLNMNGGDGLNATLTIPAWSKATLFKKAFTTYYLDGPGVTV